MKILSKGRIKQIDERPWWLCCKHICDRCGTAFMLEEGDPVDVVTERSINGESIATSTCPICEHRVQTKRSNASRVVYRSA